MTDTRLEFLRYLCFETSLADLRARLGNTFVLRHDGDDWELSVDATVPKPVQVTAADVSRAVDLALHKSVGVDDLEAWANVILLSDAFAVDADASDADREVLLDCLHALASPRVHGPLDETRLVEIKARCRRPKAFEKA